MIAAAFFGLFIAGAGIGVWLSRTLAPGSWLAEVVSFFVLPVAFATSLQAWSGLAIATLVWHFVRAMLGSTAPTPQRASGGIPGAWIFVPISSGFALVAGTLVGIASSTRPFLVVATVYWLVGTAYGVLAWRLARRGNLTPPESF
jgi:hypothetical protein